MIELFRVGLNQDGFYVYPINSPPVDHHPRGDEVTLQQASDLRDSLNRSVADYIDGLVANQPYYLLRLLQKKWGWQHVLADISDLLRRSAHDARDTTDSVFLWWQSTLISSLLERWL